MQCKGVESRPLPWQHRLMKHDHLCAIGHNVADSLASGLALVIGYHPVDVFAEAACSHDGLIEIDFLHGEVLRGDASDNLRLAALRFAEALPTFCSENGAVTSDFQALSVTFDGNALNRRASLYVADQAGRSSVTEYAGVPLKRIRVLDSNGRIRRTPRHRAVAHS